MHKITIYFLPAPYLTAKNICFANIMFIKHNNQEAKLRLTFINRKKEIEKIDQALKRDEQVFILVYGRRRCGKSRLLQHVVSENDIYYVADQQERVNQISSVASEIARKIPGFDLVSYPSWESLFLNLNARAKRICLILDEFPYLVQSSKELPSVIQNLVDNIQFKINLIICGSSQRMMQGLVLNSNAPLYGRATEIIKIRPLEPAWITDALDLNDTKAIEAYSVWGGVPRYWELAKNYESMEEAIKNLILDRDGILHGEPVRLLLDDVQRANQVHSLLSIIANGCNRLSKIATRIEKPASSLTRPLSNLIDLGYIKRELPFGENIKSTKRTLYKLIDPFLMFWYKFIQKNQSILELGFNDEVYNEISNHFSYHVAEVWEEIARNSVVFLKILNIQWKPGQRWWGKGLDGNEMEIDIIAESFDGKHLLFGEVKWENSVNIKSVAAKLKKNIKNFPKLGNRKVVTAFWLKQFDKKLFPDKTIILPEDVLKLKGN